MRVLLGLVVALVAVGQSCDEQLETANKGAIGLKNNVASLESLNMALKGKVSELDQVLAARKEEFDLAANKILERDLLLAKGVKESESMTQRIAILQAESAAAQARLNADTSSAQAALNDATVMIETLTSQNAELSKKSINAEHARQEAAGKIEIARLKASAECEASKLEEAQAARERTTAEMQKQMSNLDADHAKAISQLDQTLKIMETRAKELESTSTKFESDYRATVKQLEQLQKQLDRTKSDLAVAKSKEAEPYIFSVSQGQKIVSGYWRVVKASHNALIDQLVPVELTHNVIRGRKLVTESAKGAASMAAKSLTNLRVMTRDVSSVALELVNEHVTPLRLLLSPYTTRANALFRARIGHHWDSLNNYWNLVSKGATSSTRLLVDRSKGIASAASAGVMEARVQLGKSDPSLLQLLPHNMSDLMLIIFVFLVLFLSVMRIAMLIRQISVFSLQRVVLPLIGLLLWMVVMVPLAMMARVLSCSCCRPRSKKPKVIESVKSPQSTTQPLSGKQPKSAPIYNLPTHTAGASRKKQI